MFSQRTANGGVPAQALLDTVEAYLEDIGRRTLCDTLVVAGITTVQYEIAAQITVPPGTQQRRR